MMDEQRARAILKSWIEPNGHLSALDPYVNGAAGDTDGITLDGGFSAEQLEALAWWMRNGRKGPR
jgi:hypothetical protein